MHATAEKFGFPHTLVQEYDHWVLLLRPVQATLGALVLVARAPVLHFSDLEQQAFCEMHSIIGDIEHNLPKFRICEKFNYLMLMMADPHVHFHVLPRSAETQYFDGLAFPDAGWPGQPQLTGLAPTPPDVVERLVASLRTIWTGDKVP